MTPHNLAELAGVANQPLGAKLLELQVFAVEARHEERPFPLPAPRHDLLMMLEAELQRRERAVQESA